MSQTITINHAHHAQPATAQEKTNSSLGSRCQRCGGLMMPDHCLDVLSDTAEIQTSVLRCYSCGELVDDVILMNRFRSLHPEFRSPGRRRSDSPKPQVLTRRSGF